MSTRTAAVELAVSTLARMVAGLYMPTEGRVSFDGHDLPRLEHTIELAAAIPGAQLCVIPGATHAVLYERAELADEIVRQFLTAPIGLAQRR